MITKHPGTGGAVSVGTVTAQLLYEIGGARYANPDVTLPVDTIELSDDGPDRVRISGVRGEPPPPTLKVSLNSIGGFRNEMTLVLTGLDIEAKAELVRRQLETSLTVKPAELEWTLAPPTMPTPTPRKPPAPCWCALGIPTPSTSAVNSLPLQSNSRSPAIPVHEHLASRRRAVYGVSRRASRGHRSAALAVHADGSRTEIPPRRRVELAPFPPFACPSVAVRATRRVPLGLIAGARSGDKGGADVGVWVRTEAQWRWRRS